MSVIIFLIAVPVAFKILENQKLEKKWNEELGQFCGHFKVEYVSGKLKRKVGETFIIKIDKGDLIFRPVSNPFDFKLFHLSKDDFAIRPTNIVMKYVRDSKGEIIGLVSKPDPRDYHFTLRKIKDDGRVTTGPLE